ncbi:ribonuclease H family protein [Ferrimonas pelagia]|uniref:ribonuclease H n=1 Tax=Ferrimonas pelagia TaxID=1177826 RepID=A0ABP9FEQ5_9GAMM
MAKKFYVVWQGRETGIFTEWPKAQAAVSGFAGAKYKSYPSREAAMAALKMGHQKALGAAAAKPASASTRKASAPTARKTSAAQPDSDVLIYCDGACDPNPGNAGTGVAVYRQGQLTELWYGLYNPQGTNNTAELNGLHQSLLLAEQALQEDLSITVLCDSVYAINCVSVWADGWKKKGWKKAGGEIKNLALIQTIHALWQTVKDRISLQHVKGHAGIEGNELADRMSMVAVQQREIAWVRYPAPYELSALLAMRAG